MESEVRMGGQAVLRVFAQGERDIGPILTGGSLGSVINARHPAVSIEAVVEPAGRTDLLQQKLAGDPVPTQLVDMGFGEAFLQAQFSTSIADPTFDVVLLSAASDLAAAHWVHRTHGWIISPPADWRTEWSPELRTRIESEFEESGLLGADDYTAAVRDVIGRVRETSEAHILLVGASTIGEDLALTYHDRDDDHRLRSHRVNTAQIRLSMALGVSVIDVDRVIANVGGAGEVHGPLDYSDTAVTAICEELTYVIGDIGFFEERPLVAQVGQEWGA